MEKNGWYWCEQCEKWFEDKDHRKVIHNIGS